MSDKNVVDFPVAEAEIRPEEENRRVMDEAMRLANLTPGEWRLWIDRSAERLGIPRNTLGELIGAIIEDSGKKAREAKAEARRQEERVRREQKREQSEQKREQERINREAERKSKEKRKAFKKLISLPSEQHEGKLAELAKQLDEDIAAIRDEFAEFCGAESSATPLTEWHVEPWPEPVTAAALLQEIIAKVRKHVVARSYEVLAIALWVMMSWVHDIAARHSAYLVVTSAEPDSGKTTLLGVLRFQVPRPLAGAEPTGPSIFRVVDRNKPTLITDEADDLFHRKTDVKHIFNAGWTRGTRIPRQVQGVTYWFDPFCPKIVGLLGMKLPRTLVGRSITIKLVPKKPDEKIADFSHVDDKEFVNLRRKLARWAADNAVVLNESNPLLPPHFGNRLAANWRLLLAIAEQAGGNWPKQARDAAQRLSRTARKPSLGPQLLAAMRAMFATGRAEITSQEVVAELLSDPDAPWCEYRGGPITQRQVADLLEQYDIFPVTIHPTKRAGLSRRGYRVTQFTDAFERYLPRDPHIRTRRGKERRK